MSTSTTSQVGPLRWGLIGASDIAATALIPALRAIGHDPVAVTSGSLTWAQQYADQHGIAHVSNSVDELLARTDVDAVYVSSTNEKHRAQVVAAAAAGKHVLCEKPLATSLADAIAMVEACDTAKVVFATNHHMPASAANQAIKRLVGDGAVGDVVGVHAMFAVQLAERLRTWRLTDPSAGGGAVLDLAVHSASVIRNAIGGQARTVMSINTQQGPWESAVEDASMAIMEWDRNILVSTHEAFTVPNNVRALHIMGTEGTIIAQGVIGGGGGEVWLTRDNQTEQIDVGPRTDLYETTLLAFARAVAGEGEPIVSGRGGTATLALALAELESARTGQRVTVERPFDVSVL